MPKIEKPSLKKQDARKSNGGARENAGRPAFEPTDAERKQVEALSGYGLPIEQIGALVRDGIHIDTLRAHFSSVKPVYLRPVKTENRRAVCVRLLVGG